MYKESFYNVTQSLDNGKILVFNTFSGAMICVSNEYYNRYIKKCEEYKETNILLKQGFIVKKEVDEPFRVSLRRRMFAFSSYNEKIHHLTVLLTSGCNASCWYCFEKGSHKSSMSNETADALIEFIDKYGDKEGIDINWFGGEPTLRKDLIFYISQKLLDRGFKIKCKIVTNGYLFDKSFMETMKKYNLVHAQISIDALNEKYNLIKKYIYKDPNPFETIIKNIDDAINYDFHTSIRLNFSDENYLELADVIDYLYNRYQNKIGVYVAPITGNNSTPSTIKEPFLFLIKKLIKYKYIKALRDINLEFIPMYCGAAIPNNFLVDPNGNLFKCAEELSGDTRKNNVGNIFEGPCYNNNMKKWIDDVTDPKCINCVMLPLCQQGCKGSRLKVGGLEYDCIPTKEILKETIKLMYESKKGGAI